MSREADLELLNDKLNFERQKSIEYEKELFE